MKMTSEEMRLFGITETKLKVLDLLIDLSEEKGGILTTSQIKGIRNGLEAYDKKMEVIEKLKGEEKR